MMRQLLDCPDDAAKAVFAFVRETLTDGHGRWLCLAFCDAGRSFGFRQYGIDVSNVCAHIQQAIGDALKELVDDEFLGVYDYEDFLYSVHGMPIYRGPNWRPQPAMRGRLHWLNQIEEAIMNNAATFPPPPGPEQFK